MEFDGRKGVGNSYPLRCFRELRRIVVEMRRIVKVQQKPARMGLWWKT